MQWFEERQPWADDWSWAAECVYKFLDVINSDADRIVWLAPQSASEHCGFLWYLHRTKAPPTQLIMADYPLPGAWRGEPPRALGELGQDQLSHLLDNAVRCEWDGTRFPIEKWRTLMDDGAILRVIDNGMLKSARPDHYDDWILKWCPSVWTKWHRVVGDAMGHASQPIDDLFLRWRLQELIASGDIECDGKLPGWYTPSTTEPAKVRRAV